LSRRAAAASAGLGLFDPEKMSRFLLVGDEKMRFFTPVLVAMLACALCSENVWAQKTAGKIGSRITVRSVLLGKRPTPLQRNTGCKTCGPAKKTTKAPGCKTCGSTQKTSCAASRQRCRAISPCRSSCYPRSTIVSELACDVGAGLQFCLQNLFPCNRCCDDGKSACGKGCQASCADSVIQEETPELQPPPPPTEENETDPFGDDPVSMSRGTPRVANHAPSRVKRAVWVGDLPMPAKGDSMFQRVERLSQGEPAVPLRPYFAPAKRSN